MIKSYYKLIFDTTDGDLLYEIQNDLRFLDNLSLIEAPNDFGKSTLLHCIALSCYGDNPYFQDRIKDSGLLDKMNMLYNNPRVKLEFDITIEAHGKHFNAKKSLNSKQITRTLDGNPTSFEFFKEKFDIIYQIPSNPVHRLKGIIKDVTKSVNDYTDIIKGHDDNLEEIIENIEEDPKERLSRIKDDINTIKDQLKTLDKKKEMLTEKTQHFSNYITIKEYEKLIVEKNGLLKELENIKHRKNVKKRATTKKNKTIENVKNFNDNIVKTRQMYIENINELDLDNVSLTSHLKQFNELDLISDFKENKGEKFWNLVLDIDEIIFNTYEDIVNDEKVKNTNYLKELKSYLEEFPKNIKDEGISTPVELLLNEINQFLDKTSDADLDIIFQEINSIKDELDSYHENGISLYDNYNSLSDDEKIDLNVSDAELKITSIANQLNALSNPLKNSEAKLHLSGYDDDDKRQAAILLFKEKYKKFSKYNLDKIKSEFYSLNESLNDTNKNINTLTMAKSVKENEKEVLKNQKSDEFVREIEGLVQLGEIFQSLLGKLDELEQSLDQSVRESNIIPLKNDFEEHLQKFLAQKIPEIPIEEDGETSQHKVKSVDHINEIFILDDEKEIPFLMFGSGRTSSISYLSTINSLSPDKLTVLLLDEALMDDISFDPLKEAMIEQYNAKNIFAGLFVRYSHQPKIKALMD